MNLWWLKFDLPLPSGIVKAMELTSLEASATDDAEVIIIINKAKLVKKLKYITKGSLNMLGSRTTYHIRYKSRELKMSVASTRNPTVSSNLLTADLISE
ncbi:hypothetical protein TNIN_74681 [Trichonephila inaurata madagascariensis]|uniref:Uncharacterized protein n=1 Tax=Trichonephila inaurata madagascariensis TaxID=2747483 RepID=A0A8X6Y7X5_9ARAC|nr:hypothetical protein TNIN_74681 [Trichonephila inaurata madagascariensis]